jgi:hypothetical protein
MNDRGIAREHPQPKRRMAQAEREVLLNRSNETAVALLLVFAKARFRQSEMPGVKCKNQ